MTGTKPRILTSESYDHLHQFLYRSSPPGRMPRVIFTAASIQTVAAIYLWVEFCVTEPSKRAVSPRWYSDRFSFFILLCSPTLMLDSGFTAFKQNEMVSCEYASIVGGQCGQSVVFQSEIVAQTSETIYMWRPLGSLTEHWKLRWSFSQAEQVSNYCNAKLLTLNSNYLSNAYNLILNYWLLSPHTFTIFSDFF